MQPVQIFAQLVSAVVAVLGAAGYLFALGAVVLWVRLREAKFSREVPISFASREELIVTGAQALAIWLILALALTLLTARLLATSREIDRGDLVFDLVFGLSASIATLAAIGGERWWVITPVALLLVLAIGQVLLSALALRPPRAVVMAALVPCAVGIGLPITIAWVGDDDVAITVLTAWGVFAAVLLCVLPLRAQRERLSSTTAVLNGLELEREASSTGDPAGSPARSRTETSLLATLRERRQSARTRLWLRAVAVGALGLLVLGGVAVGSQYDKKHLFREAVVSLDGGQCVKATYLARNKEQVVLGDQRRFVQGPNGKIKDTKEPNKVVVYPTSKVLELQVRDPARKGIQLTTPTCSDEGIVAPTSSNTAPKTAPGSGTPSAPGEMGEQGATGAPGASGSEGAKGAQGDRGARGEAGTCGPRGQRGPRGHRGRPGPRGQRGRRGPRGPRGPAIGDG
jgi:Collagen triple helix repeat (20 copies)